MAFSRFSLPLQRALTAAAVLIVLAIALPWLLAPLAAAQLRGKLRERGLEARWDRLAFSWPLTLDVRGLSVNRTTSADPVVTARHVLVALGPRGLSLRPRVARLVLEDAHVTLPASGGDEDGVATAPADEGPRGGPASPRVRAAAQQLADALLLPARRLPELRLSALQLQRGDSLFARLDAVTLTHRADGLQFAATGMLSGERAIPFDVTLRWDRDDRLVGRVGVRVPQNERGWGVLALTMDGRITQDRRAGVLRVAQGTHVSVGRAEMKLSGEVARAGPRVRLALEVDGLTAHDVQRSLPRAVLGPLADLAVSGSWDWHASLDVNVDEPDSARFTADVIPHGLQLGDSDTGLRLSRLSEPFQAEIHVPKGIVYRDLSDANPNFRPIERISPLLRYALLTNEDGGFYRHRGFNTEAIQLAMAANLRAGSFKRGAGTVTMQLARNLFLGHRRALSRKGQEVVLAWVLEHLTGLSKDRLLEIYLNIIEWGPDVHGAAEASRFYFDRDPADLTVDEALFLTVLVPSPSRWRTRVDAHGELRPWARAQMAYIARKMADHGWLPPEQVPDATTLRVTLRGAAAQVFTPADSTLDAREVVHF